MSDSARVFKGSFIYTATSMLTKVGSFFLLPLYTAFLSTEDYGTSNLVASFQGVMGYVVSLCMMHAVMRFYADTHGDRNKTASLFGTVFAFVLISGLFWIVVALLLRPLLERYVFIGIDFFPVVFVGILAFPGFSLYLIYQNALRAMEQSKKFSVLAILYFLAMVSLNIIFVVKLSLGALGIVLTTFILNSLYSVFAVIDLARQGLFAFRIDWNLLRELIAYSAPLLPHNLSMQVSVLVSSALIGRCCSLSSLGLYSLANQFGQIADTIQTSVNTAYQPWFYRKLIDRKNGYKSEIREITNQLLSIYCFVFLGLALFSKEAIFLFASDGYRQAWIYVPIIVSVFTLKTPYYFFIDVLYFRKDKARLIFIASVASSLVNVAVTFWAVPAVGVIGSMLADVIATGVLTALVVVLSINSENVGYKSGPFIAYSVSTVATIGFVCGFDYIYSPSGISLWSLGIKVLVLIVCLLGVVVINRDSLIAFLRSRTDGDD